MKRIKALLLILMSITAFFVVFQPNSYVKAQTQITVQPQSSGDDVTVVIDLNFLATSDLSLYVGYGQEGETQYIAIRFPNVQIPQGATIENATLYLYQEDALDITVIIYGELSTNATQITSVSDYQSRTKTTASTTYTLPAVRGGWISIDVTQIIQEIVNQAGWTSGNALQLFIEFDSATTTGYGQFTAYDAGINIPYLVITYSAGSLDISLSADATSKNSPPYQSVSFTITLTNNGTATGTYSISASDTLGWTLSLNTTSVTLDAGQSAKIGLTVNVPFAQAGTQDSITVTVTESNTGLQRSITLTVTEDVYISFDITGAFDGMYFDGASSYVLLDDPNTMANSYFDNAVYQRTVFIVYEAEDVTSTQILYEEGGTVNGLNIYISGGRVFVGAWSESTSWNGVWLNTTTTAGEEHAVMYVFDYSGSGTFSMYYDGNLVDSVSVPSYVEAHGGDDALGTVKLHTKFHTGDAAVDLTYFFKGKIKYFIVWDRPLNSTEIQQVFSNPNNPPTTGLVLFYAPDSISTSLWVDKSGTGNDGTVYNAIPYSAINGVPGQTALLHNLTVQITSNVNFNVNVWGTDFSDGNGNTIPVGNFYADKDGVSPYDLTLSTTAQTLYANQVYSENLSLPVYLFVSLPSPLPAGTYSGTIYVDVVQA